MILPGRDVPLKAFAKTFVREFIDDYIADFSASVAFSALLSVFPFLVFAVALASLVIDPNTLNAIVDQIRQVAPPQAAELVIDRLHALTTGSRPDLVTLSGVGAIWAASGAAAALTTAFNMAHDVVETRPFWRTRGMAILVTLAAAVFFIVASLLAIATPAVARALGPVLGTVVNLLRIPVAGLMMIAVVACLYYFLPNVKRDFRLFTTGSVTAVIGWIGASLAFSEYVSHFGKYEIVYGALGGVIVLLLWIWISALVIITGAEIDSILDSMPKTRGAEPSAR